MLDNWTINNSMTTNIVSYSYLSINLILVSSKVLLHQKLNIKRNIYTTDLSVDIMKSEPELTPQHNNSFSRSFIIALISVAPFAGVTALTRKSKDHNKCLNFNEEVFVMIF